jgi:uncharacterized protein (DUF3084 family)
MRENSRVCSMLPGFAFIGLMAALLAGCDYWPPALQAEIERLQNEVKQGATERAALEDQLTSSIKLREELQTRVEDLTRTNQELAARVASSEQAIIAERQKNAKMAEAARKVPVKITAKTSGQSLSKKTAKTPVKTKVVKSGKASQASERKTLH